jgi:protein-disulfide isomerase
MTRPFVSRCLRASTLLAAATVLSACEPDAAPAAQRATAGAAAVAAPTRVVVQGVDLTGIGYDRGDPRAPIVMVEFSDFGCPYCARHAQETLPALERQFIATGKLFYKYVPFVMGMFPNGERAARAAECAGEQERFWPMHDSVYAHQRDWKRGGDPDAVLTGLARRVASDAAQWTACYAGDRRGDRTRAANAAARRLGVRVTPTFFIDGQLVEGALPLPIMQRGLNALLQERAPR